MITKQECLKFLRELIDVQIATVDKNGNPQNRTIDVMSFTINKEKPEYSMETM